MDRMGRYEVEGEIGRGAMGIVYLARDPRVRRRLALKTFDLPEGVAADSVRELRERFIREAQSAGALNHPAIVTIYDVVDDPARGTPFIAMEYVPGNSLRELLRRAGRLPPEQAVDMACCLAEGLQAAHEAGVVHRDIKPANILVRHPDGAFKLADFGIARLSDSELTQARVAVGSPAYMSPEQTRSQDVDGRSDLFSLAVVLYECLVGRPPFEGRDMPALIHAIGHARPQSVSALVPGLPPAMDAFFERALAKSPGGRYQDGEAFARALRRLWNEKPEPAAGEHDRSVAGIRPGPRPAAAAGAARAFSPDGSGEEEPRGYRPRASEQTRRRLEAERQLTSLPVIPLSRRGRKGDDTDPLFATDGDRRSGGQRLSGSHPEWTTSTRLRRRRRWRLRGLALALLLAAAGIWAGARQAVPARTSMVLDIESRLAAGTILLQVDGRTVWARDLTPGDGPGRDGRGRALELRTTVTLPTGRHLLQVLVKPSEGRRNYQEQVQVDLRPDAAHRLKVITGPADNPLPTLAFR